VPELLDMAKALLDNALPFTISMLSTHGFSALTPNASAPNLGNDRLS
jgi:hypothetical protein